MVTVLREIWNHEKHEITRNKSEKEKVTTDEHGRTQMESGQWSVASGQWSEGMTHC
jgi:hypothetical protein